MGLGLPLSIDVLCGVLRPREFFCGEVGVACPILPSLQVSKGVMGKSGGLGRVSSLSAVWAGGGPSLLGRGQRVVEGAWDRSLTSSWHRQGAGPCLGSRFQLGGFSLPVSQPSHVSFLFLSSFPFSFSLFYDRAFCVGREGQAGSPICYCFIVKR